MTRINPLSRFGKDLLSVEKPARYIGGEFGSTAKEGDLLTVALAFPDLYEIGMSNQAIRILYQGINALPAVRCERVFVPAPDFEALLRRTGTPLYTLESGIPLDESDILGISIGYELCGTGIITLLESGGIPRHAPDRGEGDPVVIAGGPAVTNPLPFSPFLDAVWVGEAEAGFFDLCGEAAERKARGLGRKGILELLASNPHVWMKGKRARRAIWEGFSSTPALTSFPVPSIKTVQDHGSVEIMRGCPNGCRFCHAGFAYRPQRMKAPEVILEEVADRVEKGGYREVSLSSLSSGDYEGIDRLLAGLNDAWKDAHVSFQLPSLKVNSFTLPILESLATVRKSSLTFAVETPCDQWQLAINKEVFRDKIVDILLAAKEKGWKQAKLYFMIGLPIGANPQEEIRAIAELMGDLVSRTRIAFNINVGTFVPKPHTPFQWTKQLTDEEAYAALLSLRHSLPKSVHLSFQSPLISELEGLVSRGDERSSQLFENAWERGMRLEAWEETRNLDDWKTVMAGLSSKYREAVLGERDLDSSLPWSDVNLGVSLAYLKEEKCKAERRELTSICIDNCTHLCGSCKIDGINVINKVQYDTFSERLKALKRNRGEGASPTGQRYRMLFSYAKKGKAIYYPHLALMDLFSKSLLRGKFPVLFSQGFNPQPHIELAQPLAMGIESEEEWGLLDLSAPVDTESFIRGLNGTLPEGLSLKGAWLRPSIADKKNKSLASVMGGCSFLIENQPSLGALQLENVSSESRENGYLSLVVRTESSGKENQALYPFKVAFGEKMDTWPVLPKRTACFAKGEDGSLISYEAWFLAYYR